MTRYQSSIDLLMVRKQTSTNIWNYFFRGSSYITTIGFLFLQYGLYRFKYLSQCSLASATGSSLKKIVLSWHLRCWTAGKIRWGKKIIKVG